MAALAKDPKDFDLFARAFAKRGMGVLAVAPPRGSTTHTPVVESFVMGGVITPQQITVDDSLLSCNHDGILDNGEAGKVTVTLRNTGTLPIDAIATITEESGTLQFPHGNRIHFVTTAPFQSATASVIVAMDGAAPKVPFTIKASIDATNLAVPGAVSVQGSFTGNYQLVTGSSSSDTMEDPSSVWTPGGNSMLDSSQPWQFQSDAGGGRWSIPDAAAPSDQWLITPALPVQSTGTAGFTLHHRYTFEADSSSNYDGGVIEISTDDGKTWSDLGAAMTGNGYTGVVWTDNTVLANRHAFVGQSAGYPAYVNTSATLPSSVLGQTIRLRFRVGTDPAVGAAGWDLQGLQLSGIVNRPFSSRRPFAGCPVAR
jgi:hypothetical protein